MREAEVGARWTWRREIVFARRTRQGVRVPIGAQHHYTLDSRFRSHLFIIAMSRSAHISAALGIFVIAACSRTAPDSSAERGTSVASAASGKAIAPLTAATVYKSPTCGCCAKWVDHLRENGFAVTVEDRDDMNPIKSQYGVAESVQACHTAIIEGYVVEGHVPAEDIRRLLRERPAVAGIAAPGMPAGSPGMEVGHAEAYDVVTFTAEGKKGVFVSH